MSLLRRYRIWKLERRLARLLLDEGLPEDCWIVFRGQVTVESSDYEIPEFR